MNYIRKVILENFQSHKYTELVFDENLNVILGPSDQGKTAIIRGMKWALFNEPVGDYFIREGETECSVTIEFNNNIKIKRFRSKTKNCYYLYDNYGKETIYESFGTKVPQEIIDHTSIKKVLLDESISNSINIGEQLESPFLLSEKNSTKANSIGRLVGVHIVDDALRDTLKDTRNLNIKKKSYEENSDKLNTSLAKYDYLDEMILKYKRLNTIKEDIAKKQLMINKLIEKLGLLNKVSNEIQSLNIHLDQFINLDKAIMISNQLTDNIKSHNLIYKRYNTYNLVIKNIKYNNKIVIKLNNLDKIENSIDKLNKFTNKIIRLNNLAIKQNSIKATISSDNSVLNNLKYMENVEKNIETISVKYEKIKKMNDLKIKFDNVKKRISLGIIYIEKLTNLKKITSVKNLINIKNERIKILLGYKKKYDIYANYISKEKENLDKINNKMDKLLKEYEITLNKIEICPLCLSPIDERKINNIISSYARRK